mmetsp:Transcript_22380/g.52277  ORF Transcript_22380/g.52277 Transcript_22380/m.52277 type:complete len:374 (-) Transcript_22380:226-1347(-)
MHEDCNPDVAVDAYEQIVRVVVMPAIRNRAEPEHAPNSFQPIRITQRFLHARNGQFGQPPRVDGALQGRRADLAEHLSRVCAAHDRGHILQSLEPPRRLRVGSCHIPLVLLSGVVGVPRLVLREADGVRALPDLCPLGIHFQGLHATLSGRSSPSLAVHRDALGELPVQLRDLRHRHVEDLLPEQLRCVKAGDFALADCLSYLRRVDDLLHYGSDVGSGIHVAVLPNLVQALPTRSEIWLVSRVHVSLVPPLANDLMTDWHAVWCCDVHSWFGRQAVQNLPLRALRIKALVDFTARLHIAVHAVLGGARVHRVQIAVARRGQLASKEVRAGDHLCVHGDLAHFRDVVVARIRVQQLPLHESLHLGHLPREKQR